MGDYGRDKLKKQGTRTGKQQASHWRQCGKTPIALLPDNNAPRGSLSVNGRALQSCMETIWPSLLEMPRFIAKRARRRVSRPVCADSTMHRRLGADENGGEPGVWAWIYEAGRRGSGTLFEIIYIGVSSLQ